MALFLQIDLDDPFVAQELTTGLAATVCQAGYTVAPATLPPNAEQPMGGTLLEIAQQTGQHIIDNQDFYKEWLGAIGAIVGYLQARHDARTVEVTQGERSRTLTQDSEANEALLREIILDTASVTVSICDQA